MKAVMLMFDSLNRHFLRCYGGHEWVHTPNFDRLAQRSVRFNRAYCGSMPCMPARRELHTARPNFLHCPWGGLEPFDDSTIELLGRSGVHTHLASDHYHYWEENSNNYHTKYSTWEFFRGQEGDPWIGQVAPPDVPEHINGKGRPQDWINRPHIATEATAPTPLTVDAGLKYIRRNRQQDNWFCQIECFDPHEPFCFDEGYKKPYSRHFDAYEGPLFDWPGYRKRENETDEQVEHVRHNYAALVSQCDAQLGRVLDLFDELDLWSQTMLIVNTDHGHFLGERDHFAKNYMPWWEELSHLPLFIHDPRCPQADGQQRNSLVQTIDLGPTLMEYFGVERTEDMLGQPLRSVIESDTGGRGAGLFGIFGQHVNVTDGRYVYMRAATTSTGGPCYQYTLLPTRLRRDMLQGRRPHVNLADPLPFSKGLGVLRIGDGRGGNTGHRDNYGTLLYDLENDPHQQHPLDDADLEKRMAELLVEQMRIAAAPSEQYQRLGLV